MNLPNKLTVLRVILVPFFVFFLLGADWIGSFSPYIALIIFIVASLTDMLDGKIARKYNLITNFGKFMDPLADKLLVCSALICFVDMHRMPTWVVLIVIAREFIISGFRLIAAENGRVIAAGIWGKAKTVVQMIMCILLIMDVSALSVVTTIAIYAALILTIISLVDYIVHNLDVLSDQK